MLAALVVALIAVAVYGGWRLAGDEPSRSGLAESDSADRAAVQVGKINEDAPTELQSSVTVVTDGSLRIAERVTFASARSSITVSIPDRTGATGRFDPRVEDLRLLIDGQAEQRLDGFLTKGHGSTFHLPAQATSAVLEYTVTGTVIRSSPSAPERALALVTPLSIESAPRRASRIEIAATDLLNVGCTAVDGSSSACGTRTSRGWVVERGPDHAAGDVVAQIDLPAP